MLTALHFYRSLDSLISQQSVQRDWRFLDYAHGIEGVALYHGSVSDLSGPILSTWTYEEAGQKVRRDRPITEDTFAFLFDGFARFDVFRRGFVSDFETPINPFSHHVVQFAFRKGEQVERGVLLIAADDPDPDFARWLAALDVPRPSEDNES